MQKIPKMSGVLRGNCCETCRNIPQKTPLKFKGITLRYP